MLLHTEFYDVLKEKGFCQLMGIDHDGSSSICRRKHPDDGGGSMGRKALYPDATALLITADGGGSNGVRNRLFKSGTATISEWRSLFPLLFVIIHTSNQ